ncbi:AAA family ATPase [Paracoccus sp. p3-h83]|uniref:AAA family ATPase n=1 Tax=Paracoccus sp. p3-h83 TaxID=3342805 RepID=UPI0035BAE65B
MKPVFVQTSNYKRFTTALSRLDGRGAREACMVVVDGKPGLGKTATMMHWAAQTGCIYLRAQKGWDYSWFIQELLTELQVTNMPRGRRERFRLALEILGDRSVDAEVEGRPFGLMIDEADLISNKPEVMEAVRGVSDLKHMPTILVGMGKLRDNLRRFPQIESRAPNKVEFLPATLDDATALVSGLCEVQVAADLIALIWKLSRGFSREIVEAISAVERFGHRLDVGPQGVTRADMAGQVLMNNRETGKPIIVTEADHG